MNIKIKTALKLCIALNVATTILPIASMVSTCSKCPYLIAIAVLGFIKTVLASTIYLYGALDNNNTGI